MPAAVIVGAQWGDEGKGKIVDLLSARADIVARFQGGNNAGHTLVVDQETTVLHLIPSGVLHPNTTCVIGPGVVIDAAVLADEVNLIKGKGLLEDPNRLQISASAALIMPYHKMLDHAREEAAGKRRIGTTGRGIGPAYEDIAGRRSIPTRALRNPDDLRDRVQAILPEKNALLDYYGQAPLSVDEVIDAALEQGAPMVRHITDTGLLISNALNAGKNVLFEGAQGTLLDVIHGTVPFVTSSHTVASAACTGSGIGPKQLGSIIGIAKAYVTRVGGGPFPTGIGGEREESIRASGGEYGATTGRPRRCGWLDLPALRYAVRVNGLTELAFTKLDVLSGQETLRVATHYRLPDGSQTEEMPAGADVLSRSEPVYMDVEGWSEDLRQIRLEEDLPPTARAYLELVSNEVGVPINIIGIGPGRGQTVLKKNPFA
jgi:adenylosuccinate synthase